MISTRQSAAITVLTGTVVAIVVYVLATADDRRRAHERAEEHARIMWTSQVCWNNGFTPAQCDVLYSIRRGRQ